MPSFRFFHAADLHLDSPLRGLERYEGAPAEEIRGATRRAFVNLVTTALAERVAFVVLAGDLFDGDWKDFGTGLFFAQQLRRLGDGGIEVFLLHGNHDAAAHMTRQIEWPSNVTVFATKAPQSVTHASTGAVLHGQGFATRAVEQDLAVGYPQAVPGAFNIGVLHTALDGRAGHDPYAPCSIATLTSKGYDYWALGHVHARERVSESPWIVFPGNLQGRHLRETGSKGATLVEVVDGIVTSVEHVALDVVRFARVDVDVADIATRAAALDRAQQALSHALDETEGRLLVARVHLIGRTAADAGLRAGSDRVLAELRDAANTLGRVWLEGLWFDTTSPTTSTGRDLLEALALDDPSLVREVIASVRDSVAPLLRTLDAELDVDRSLATAFDDARTHALDTLLGSAEGRSE